MNEALKSSLAGIIRHLITTGGGAIGLKGVIDEQQSGLITGAVMTLVGVGWSIWQKYRTNANPKPSNTSKLIAPIILALAMTGCIGGKYPIDSMVQDARDVGEGVSILLTIKPEYRSEIVIARDALAIVEKAEELDLLAVVDIVESLHLEDLNTPESQAYILAARIVIRRLQNQFEIGNINDARPIVVALREGLDYSLSQ